MILDKIVQAKREEVAALKSAESLESIRAKGRDLPPARDFRGALGGPEVSVIAEIKRKSPSRGVLAERFDPPGLAGIYEREGAAAVSVLTDREFFGGERKTLGELRKIVKLPLLRKDFILDPYQVHESRVLGADALLLIASILEPSLLRDLLGLAGDRGLHALVEVHSEEDLEKALWAGAGIVGINNRDLRTFETDLSVTERLAPLIPPDRVAVSESGIRTAGDVERLKRAGIRAFLIGEALVAAPDPGQKLREFTGR
jgi:indole-3-glycerol phosphate synthase